MSKEDPNKNFHVPNKILLYLVDLPELKNISTNQEIKEYYQKHPDYFVKESTKSYDFGPTIIYNNYNAFMEEIEKYLQKI